MNEDLLYTVDPYILSILFKTKTDDDTLDVYTKMAEMVDMVLKETIKEFLKENEFSDEEIQKVIDTEDLEKVDPKVKPYLQNIILVKRIQANSRQLIKLYYDQLLPNLSPEEKGKLEEYLKENEELLKERRELVIEGVKALKAILEANGVETYDELRAKLEKEEEGNPSVNLGGVSSAGQLGELPQLGSNALGSLQSNLDSKIADTLKIDPQAEVTPVVSNDKALEPVVEEGGNTVKEDNVIGSVSSELKDESEQNSVSLPDMNIPVSQTPEIGTFDEITKDAPAAPDLNALSSTPEIPNIPDTQAVETPPANLQSPDTVLPEAKPESPVAEVVTTETPAEGQNNAVNQLQSMGIDLNDALSQPPQS